MKRTLLLCLLLSTITLRAQENVGPDAPDVAISYDPDHGFFLLLTNLPTSNNYQTGYVEEILPSEVSPDPNWRFQGYLVYQFADEGAAEGDLFHAIHDPALARPVLGVDLNDNISGLNESYAFSAQEPCETRTWVLANSGIVNGLSAFIDPFTNEVYEPGGSYCFVVLAFGANTYHMDATCGHPDQIIFSSRSGSGGPIHVQCVAAETTGIAETADPDGAFDAAPNPANGRVRLRFGTEGDVRALRVFDAQGVCCLNTTARSGQDVDLSLLAPGVYHFVLTSPAGGRAVRRVVVE